MKTSRNFAPSPDILIVKGKFSVANATAWVASSSPDTVCVVVTIGSSRS